MDLAENQIVGNMVIKKLSINFILSQTTSNSFFFDVAQVARALEITSFCSFVTNLNIS